MSHIHPTAIVHEDAQLGNNVKIGPWCIVGGNVKIGDDSILYSNVVVDGDTEIGENNRIFHSAVLGTEPQDLKYQGDPTRLVIGSNNSIREFVTINRSATLDEPVTVGDGSLLMAYCHVAHNCHIGNGVIIANAVNLAGHVHIGDSVIIGGMTAVHQFVKIGRYAFVGGASGVKKDVPPFTRGEGMPYRVVGLNSVGLQRRGFSTAQIDSVREIYKHFYQSGHNVSDALDAVSELGELTAEQQAFVDFIRAADRGICRARG
ncbi:MAG: acyl-ACP--UDP-N-acetylglucosamine O-acyltransferase [Candidatus Cloacimonetes bacterium]|nr:acyl-ACP--UDP-N-acetylglucosamine O-acyltransferase [Candidatus Cloacimonadota bacterium]